MQGMRVGYKRVSAIDQNPERQLEHVKLDKIFLDKYTGTKFHRPAFDEMMNFLRIGDHLFVHSIDRMARNLAHLLQIVSILTEKGVVVEFIKENLVFRKDDDSPMSKLILSIIGAIAEFEHALIRERQREGIAIARAKNTYKKPLKLSRDHIGELNKMVQDRVPKTQIAKKFGIRRETVYDYMKLAK